MPPIVAAGYVPPAPLRPRNPNAPAGKGAASWPSKAHPDQFSSDAIPLRSQEGVDLLKHCAPAHLTTLPAVISHFEAPDSIFEAGIASATMVVNALGLSTQPILEQYRHDYGSKVVEFPYYTTREVIAQVDIPEEEIHAVGTTLDQLDALLKRCGTQSQAVHVDQATPDAVKAFRRAALASLQSRGSHTLVNFEGLDGRGYHSPIAAYDHNTDRFLVYNVLPPKPQPVWMSTDSLVESMATQDPVSGLNRGYVMARAANGQKGQTSETIGPMCVALDSVEGTAILQSCEARHLNSLPGLMIEHQVQANLCTSGPTSLASVGNDLGLTVDGQKLTQFNLIERLPYHLHKEMHPPGLGLNLQQLAELAETTGARVERRPVLPLEDEPRGLDTFRQTCVRALESNDTHVIVNFDRKKIGQRGRGHFSPIAAYNSTLDMFLIYETAPFRVDPVWVSAKDLHHAMAKYDDEIRSNRLPRGYLVISNPGLGDNSVSSASPAGLQ